MLTAGIIGATGYAGAELVRLLQGHPEVGRLALSSTSFEGGRMEDVYPNLLGRVTAELVKPEAVVAASDVVFAALPHGVGEAFAALCVAKGVPFIDLSADFRFGADEDTFKAWYGKGFVHPELRSKSIYGLPELYRAELKTALADGKLIIANPGCYPTGASLAAFPALRLGWLAAGATVIVDSASGVTGAGRTPSQNTHFPDCAESLAAYKVGAHRHTPELARNMAAMAGRSVPVVFTPHLAPINRGIASTVYLPLTKEAGDGVAGAVVAGAVVAGAVVAGAVVAGAGVADPSAPRPPTKAMEERTAAWRDVYAEFYKDEPFVRVLPYGAVATVRNVKLSNYCDLSVHSDQSGSILIIAGAIDNMVKGAAGQAVQNMNIVFGFSETVGLDALPAAF